jgi:glutathione S-transferase
MFTVHHLNNSRSQRILWLLEELGVDYQIEQYTRDAVTNLAPPELEAIHPLGKSPVITHGDRTVIESGAIIDYILRHFSETGVTQENDHRLMPQIGTAHYEEYLQWLHYAEGSAALPMMLKLYTSKLGDAGAALQPRINDELQRHLGYLEQALEGVDWFVGNRFSAADIQLSFVAEITPMLYSFESLPNLLTFRNRCQARPAYQIALKKGGFYAFGPAAE